MGSSIAMSMIGTLITVAIVGAVLVFVILRLARANSGGGASVQAMADPVPGTMLVTAASMPSRNSVFHLTRITGVVSGEGIAPTAVQYNGLIRTRLWPSPGKQLPVIVDRANPTSFAIQWDQIRSGGEAALDQAEALAAAMRAKQGEPPAGA
jgi:hypothetical protein